MLALTFKGYRSHPHPDPPHRKSGVPDLRKSKPISGKPEMGGEGNCGGIILPFDA